MHMWITDCTIKEKVYHFGKYACLHSCQALDERIDATLVSLCGTGARRLSVLGWHKDWRQGKNS